MSEIFDRISYLVEKEADGKAAKFGKMIGFSGQAVRYVTNIRRNNPNFEMIVSILQTFVWVNPDWLLLGKEPIKRCEQNTIADTPEWLLKRVEELAIENNELKKEIVRLKENKKNRSYSIASEPEP